MKEGRQHISKLSPKKNLKELTERNWIKRLSKSGKGTRVSSYVNITANFLKTIAVVMAKQNNDLLEKTYFQKPVVEQ